MRVPYYVGYSQCYIASQRPKNRTLDEVEEGLRVDLVDAGLRLDRAKWITYAEPAVRFAVTHMRDAQGLEPWAWGASVQIGG